MTSISAIQTTGLAKSFGPVKAVQNLNLSVKAHQITAFLGLNGAGKSTTIKMLLGMIRPSNGGGEVLGSSINDPRELVSLRRKIAYVSESKQLYDYMTVEQMIRFTRPFYLDWDLDMEKKLIATYELPLNRRIKSLSKGMRTKTALLLAFARRPELLILDEPSEGLDPIGIEQMLESLVTHCSEGTTVFFSSHQISEVERIADNVCMLHRGNLVLDAAMDDLRESYRQIDVVFPSVRNQADVQLAGVTSVRSSGRQMSILVRENADAVVERAGDLKAVSIQILPVGLREIFLENAKERE
jgi:ABC-2 type transport system ATP-binding protein